MKKIRVLIVDDSVVVRHIVSEVLSSDPALEVVATASNGRLALARIVQTPPDIVTLDVEMPEMSGLATLAEIRKTHPHLPVIMFSTVTERGAHATLEALSLGASDYVTKPQAVENLDAGRQRIREELVPKIKALCARLLPAPPVSALPPRVGLVPPQPAEVVAIGVSTGGPNALAELVAGFPENFPVPIVIVQHMPPIFTRLLAERLSAKSTLSVREAVTGDVLKPGGAWLAPGDHHMALKKDGFSVRVDIHQGPPENSCRPAVDVLFRSVAEVYGPRTLAVIMTGMGQDGLRGCETIREAGGQILAQDQASSVVWGMPGFVVNAGLAHRVVPLDGLAAEILQRIAWPVGRRPFRP